MIKEQVKCPKCNKVLLRLYSNAVKEVRCTCGHTINMKTRDTYSDDDFMERRKWGKKYANS